MKLDVPRFDGQDPLGWIFKISQFYDYQGLPDHECVMVASFYMDGPALSWYQWMTRNEFITSWPALLQALESRFAPTFYNDPQGALFQLQQRGSVNEYLTEFERLANRIIGLSPTALLSCFISGLYPDLRREVQALQPLSIPQVVALAKLQEEKLQNRRHILCSGSTHFSPMSTPASSTSPSPPILTTPSLPSRVPLKHLSPEELALRRDKGLCYHCEEK